MTDALSGRIVLVTGASSGVGEALARRLADEGAHVVCAARRMEALESLVQEIESKGGSATAVRCDVTDAASIREAFDTAEAAVGVVDSAIVNAGVNAAGPALDMEAEDFDRVIATNFRGAFLTAREAARRIVANPDALGDRARRILFIASVLGQRPSAGAVAYSATKAGVIMLARGFAREWARHDISVNAICPGYMQTDIIGDAFETEKGRQQIRGWPRRRLMDVGALEGAVRYLLSAEAESTTGAVLTVDDGQSL